MEPYRLGLDLGANSIGWCALRLDASQRPLSVLDAGVRILTPNEEAGRDPQSKASLAGNRRAARAMRRRRDRFVSRRERVMKLLVDAGLMPTDRAERKALEKLDPYWLRAAALDQRLDPYELGRALFHLNQRRGFKSNRIADADDKEKSATKAGMRALEAAVEGEARTLGEYLAHRHRRDKYGARLEDGDGHGAPESVRFRPRHEGAVIHYDRYPTRKLLEDELDAIWSAQQRHHAPLTPELLAKLKRCLIEQRPLKKPIVGRCTLLPENGEVERLGLTIDLGERAPKAHPLFQRFRILQDASQLRVTRPGHGERPLTMVEFRAAVAKLASSGGTSVDFAKLRAALKLPDDARFNYELAGRKGFAPDQTAVTLSHKNAFGKAWRSLPRERQIEVVERLLAIEDPEALTSWLRDSCGLDDDAAEFVSNVRLPQGHGQFGRAALEGLVAVMEEQSHVDSETGEVKDQPMTYDEAVRALGDGLHHSDKRPDQRARLPYYGDVMARHVIAKPDAPKDSQEARGRVPNPTVHIGLNQLRKVVNTLIDTYGPPTEIVIELARELKLNKKRKDEIQRENRENEKRNDARRAELEALGYADTYTNRLMLRLYDELPADERVCVYSGENIGSRADLLSGGIEIDHILPHSKTLDDSFMNKVLCARVANREKGNRAPGEAWSGERLQEIVERAERLFPKKAWRFQPDAMTRFGDEGGFLARQLTDTQHMARMARAYLEHVCGQVWAPPGRLTAMLRAKWGLNGLLPDHNYADTNQPKNRKDHRHHAIDAFVVACTDRGLINRIARESGRAAELDLDRLFPKDGFPEPYSGFRDDLKRRLDAIIVSHKPDHGLAPGRAGGGHATSGKLHEETAYGLVDEEIDGKRYNLVTRKPVEGLTEGEIGRVRDDGKDTGRIRDRDLRAALQQIAIEAKRDGRNLAEALAAFGKDRGIRRVRVLKTEKSVRVVAHGDGFTKAYSPGDNHCVEIFALPDGNWGGEGVTVFDANQSDFAPKWRAEHSEARLVMRLHNGDLVEADFGDGPSIYRVYRLEPSAKRVRLAPHAAAGSINDRHNDPNDPLRWTFGSYTRLKEAGARRVRVDPIGRIMPATDRA